MLLERWKRALDNHKIAGAIVTDLSKAFDCIDHGCLLHNLRHMVLTIIGFYIFLVYGRKQRMKVSNAFISWHGIRSGVPQSSIFGLLLFNIYYFVSNDLENYADDNTPYPTNTEIHTLRQNLKAIPTY